MADTANPRLSIVVAMDRNGLIGRDNGLPWHLPADLKLFKRVTMGKPMIMGRKTFESIGRPLPGRVNIVVTGRGDFPAEGCIVAHTLDDAIAKAGRVDEIMVIGGATLYRQMLDRADRIYLTLVEVELDGDTWFPPLPESQWTEVQCTRLDADENNPYTLTFKVLDRKATAASADVDEPNR